MPGNFHLLRRILGLVILILSSVIFLWGIWPLQEGTISFTIPPDRRMMLVWPAAARKGDAQSVRMQLEPDPASQPRLATASLVGEPGSNLMAAARLEFAGLLFYPADLVSQPLRQGIPLAFRWQFRPVRRGEYTGVAWLYLLAVPSDGSPESVTPISASEISIRAIDLFGLSGPVARLLGGPGILVGGLLGLDGILARLLKRSRRQAEAHPTPDITEQQDAT